MNAAGHTKRSDRIVLGMLWGGVALFAVGLVAAAWPRYWVYVAAETTPLAWLESVLLLLSAAVCGLVAYSSSMTGAEGKRATVGWIALGGAFLALGMDERFAVHERIRDRLLKPTGIRLLPWMEAGDLLLPIYAVCGLAAAWGIWRLLAERPGARVFFAAAVAAAAVSVGMDTLDIRSMDKSVERLLQSVEELLETAAMTAFLSSFLLVLLGRLAARREP